jgi:hypothetical protein
MAGTKEGEMAVEKQVKINLTAQDNVSPEINSLTKNIENKLSPANEKLAESFGKVELSALKASNGMSKTEESCLALQKSSENLINEKEVEKIEKTTNYLGLMTKALRLAASGILVFVGKEKFITAVNVAALAFSKSVGEMAEKLKDMGGIFAKISPLLFGLKDILRTNVAGVAAFSATTAIASGNIGDFKNTLMETAKEHMTLSEKMKYGSIALKGYGRVLLETEGFFSKIKGAALVAAGNIANFSAKIIEATKFTLPFGEVIGGLVKKTALLAASLGAFLAISVIDKFFVPLENAIFAVGEASAKASWNADKAFSEFAKGEGVIRKLQQSFYYLKSVALDGVSKSLMMLKEGMVTTRAGLDLWLKSSGIAAQSSSNLGRAFLSVAKISDTLKSSLAATMLKAGLSSGVFAALGTSLLGADGIMKKMAGATLVALAVAIGGVITVVGYALNAIGGLISAIGDKLTAATEKQISKFAESEKAAFDYVYTINNYSDSTEEAAEKTLLWDKAQKQLIETNGASSSVVQALIAKTIASTEAMELNSEQQQVLIQRSIDLAEKAQKPAIEVLDDMIRAMNGQAMAGAALGFKLNENSIQTSNLTLEQKRMYESADEVTKSQLRYSVIMDKTSKVTGYAAANGSLYTKAIQLQTTAIDNLNEELGKGAAIINGKYVMGLATATNFITNFFKPILPGIGFLEALTGRVLQLTGFFAKHLLTVTALTTAYKVLNKVLASDFMGSAFTAKLPLVEKSFLDMAKAAGSTTENIKSFKDVASMSLQIVSKQSANVLRSLLGLEAGAALTAKTIGMQLVKGLASVASGILGVVKSAALFIASPIGLTIAAITAGVYLLYKALQMVEEETGIFSQAWADITSIFEGSSPIMEMMKSILFEIGSILSKTIVVAVKLTAAAMTAMISTVYQVILGFQELSSLLPGSLGTSQAALDKTRAKVAALDAATQKFAGGALSDIASLFMSSAAASELTTQQLANFEKQLISLNSSISKMYSGASKAFEFAKDFTPRINLEAFTKEANEYERKIIELQGKLEEKKSLLTSVPGKSDALKKELDIIVGEISKTEEVIKAIRLKTAQETRNLLLQEVQIELNIQKNKVYSIEQEIKQIKLSSAKELRAIEIENQTQLLLEKRNLYTAEAQAGISIQQAAFLEANSIELTAYKNMLMAQKDLALSVEQQKQLELATMRSSIVAGTDSAGQAGQDIEVIKEQEKINTLNTLRAQSLIDEKTYQQDLTNIKIASAQNRMVLEAQQEQARISMLGLSPEALQAKLDLQKQQEAMELANLRLKLQNKLITEQEFEVARQQMTLANEASVNQIREQHLQSEIEQNRRRGDSWGATLKEIELAQQQHGQIMGTLRGIQASAEFGAIQGMLGNLSSLRNSSSRKEFEIGKMAAIAQATVSTFLGATQAYAALSAIPIVGPALGVAAAAAAVAAGMLNIKQIKSQKFAGGSASGSTDAPTAQVPTATLGGQGDKGIDAVPQSLSGKSFIVSGGERIVQPEANKDLTNFLEGGQSGNVVNITVNGNISSTKDAELLANRVINEIRSRSERGQIVISHKGVA